MSGNADGGDEAGVVAVGAGTGSDTAGWPELPLQPAITTIATTMSKRARINRVCMALPVGLAADTVTLAIIGTVLGGAGFGAAVLGSFSAVVRMAGPD